MLHTILNTAGDMVLAAPTPTPTPGGAPTSPTIVDVDGIRNFLLSVIGVILLVLLGLWIMSKAKSGEASRVVNASGIALLGLVFIGGAGVLVFLGDDILNLIVK